jgi:hypothetical protein
MQPEHWLHVFPRGNPYYFPIISLVNSLRLKRRSRASSLTPPLLVPYRRHFKIPCRVFFFFFFFSTAFILSSGLYLLETYTRLTSQAFLNYASLLLITRGSGHILQLRWLSNYPSVSPRILILQRKEAI